MIKKIKKLFFCSFWMQIRPLWLREKLYFKFCQKRSHRCIQLFEQAPLEFASKIQLKLIPTDISHKAIAFIGFYELSKTKRIVQLARKGGLLIDVGANCGYYSCLWAGINPKNRVLAFEPSSEIINLLRLNVKHNKLEPQVQALEMALGKDNTTLLFVLGGHGQTGWGGLLNEPEEESIKVTVTRLDDIINRFNYNYIDVLKIDTEGADAWVLQGAEKLLFGHKIRHIFFEENPGRMQKLGINPGDAKKFLQSCGYRVKLVDLHVGLRDYYASLP